MTNTSHGSSIFYSGDEQSYSHSVTNLLYLKGFDRLEEFGSLWLDRRLPQHLFLPFVHEMTHIWCYSSALGSVLSELRLNCAVLSKIILSRLLPAEEQSVALEDLRHDVIRLETAVHVLRPLAEGMALFAEYDATPSSTTLSYPTACAAALFAPHNPDNAGNRETDDDIRLIWQVLCDNRGKENIFRNKANLLFSQFTFSDESGGYLQGYLFVKSILWLFETTLGRRVDSDCFLSFLRWYFFEDWAGAAAVLDQSGTLTEASSRVVYHVGDRLIDLASADALAHFEVFEAHRLKQGNSPPKYHDWVRTRFDTEIQGRELYRKLFEDTSTLATTAVENGSDPTKYLQRYVITLNKRRNVLILCEHPAKITLSEMEVSVVLEGTTEQLIMSPFNQCAEMPLGTYSGYVSLVMGTDLSFCTLVAGTSGKAIAISPLGKMTEEQKSLVTDFVGSRTDYERFSEHIVRITSDVIKEAYGAEWLPSCLSNIDQGIDKLYRNMAFQWLPETVREENATTMRKNGFAGILGWNRELGYALGRVSIFSSLQLPGQPTRTPKFDEQLTPQQMSAVISAATKFSLPLVYEASGFLRYLF